MNRQAEKHEINDGPGGRAFPWFPLSALALAGFICIMTETLPVGLLTQVSGDFEVSESAVGLWVSVYAAATTVTVLPVIALTRGVRRKPLLLIGAAGFLIANAATALAPTYAVTLVARAVAGAFSGLVWGILAGYARRLVPPHMAGRALAVALVGTPVALSVGTPLGTFLGGIIGWRLTFGLMSVIAALLSLWIAVGVPDRPGQESTKREPVWRVVVMPGMMPVLVTTLGWILAHNILYTYIAPYITWVGIEVRVDMVLFVFGVAALCGIWLTGRVIDHALRALVLVNLCAFLLASIVLGVGGQSSVLFWVAVVVWGATFGGAATQLTTAAADSAGDAVDIAQALMVVAFNFSIFAGSASGGLLLDTMSPGALPWAAVVLVIVALAVALLRNHAFMRERHAG